MDERRGVPPVVLLDDRYYLLIDQVATRFPHGAPSLRRCTELHVTGDVYFGRDVRVEGTVKIVNDGPEPLYIEDGTRLTG